jgi:hypothetical protein
VNDPAALTPLTPAPTTCEQRRNNTLALGAGGALALYLANGLLSAIDRLPLVPGALELVGFAFSTWFTWR